MPSLARVQRPEPTADDEPRGEPERAVRDLPDAVSPSYLVNNAPRLASYAAYALFNVGLFLYAAHRYDGSGALVQIARGCGALVNFNAAFCLMPMMRLFISRVRRTKIARFLALEDSIDFHRLAGHTMFGAAIVHTIVYLVLYASRPEHSILEHLASSLASVTGVVLVLIFLVLWVCALERSRKKWRYEAFLTAHALGIPLAAILLVHSPNYWKWFLVGGTCYLLDRAVRFWRMRTPSTIVTARPLPSQVTELAIQRPPGWGHRAGDFVWILVPSVSRLEWHPFTISSPPERPDTFTLHVRTLGDWTERIRSRTATLAGERVFFDGPHGAPANDIFHVRVAVLVAAGIGVTPFASILQSMLARRASGEPFTIERVYFTWINRDHRAFEWFTEMIVDLKRDDATELFDVKLYVTAPPTGPLPPHTLHGKPDWNHELARIHAAHGSDDVGLFYCGPRALSKELHAHCRELGWQFKEEQF
ncbi:MAG TPA: ferric reductase-like transmembrane domain-containing protein [Kofleriaceae bacterium]|nr:ferric reductase-like transmembrane domain-containing protein [Kofleriaceae bacterium]